jgi:rhomboid protease GluP
VPEKTLLDQLLALVGTNRTRMAWTLRIWRRSWDRVTGRLENRSRALAYAHQTCPQCNHPAGADERVCTRCGETLGGKTMHRARRIIGLAWSPDLPLISTVVSALIVAIYATTLVWGRQVGLVEGVTIAPHSLALFRFGSLWTYSIQDGEWWRFGTSMFLHVDPLHLVFNLMSLWSVARYLEDVIGKAKTLALYLALGFISGAVSYLWHAYTPPFNGNSAGASGAICGLIGVAVGFTLRRRNVARHLFGHYIGWAIWIGILTFSSWRIDHAGHIGGLVPGFAIGLLVRRIRDTGQTARRVWLYAALVLAAVTLATLVIAAGHSLPDDMFAMAAERP